MVSLILVITIIVFWLINLQFAKIKRPPSLRFKHMAKVVFLPPAYGNLLAAIPVMIVAGCLKFWQGSTILGTLADDYGAMGT